MAEKLTAMKAIKLHCKQCCGDIHPKLCTSCDCALYSFRLGFNQSKPKRVLSEEVRQSAKQRLAKARLIKAKTKIIVKQN